MLPKIAARFAELGMECQLHPDLKLDPLKDSGLVSVRLRIVTREVLQYGNVDMLSGFEISFKDFRYTSPLALNPSINATLKACTTQVIIRMDATHTSALRAGLYFAAFLAQLADGVVYMPRSDAYLDHEQALAHITQEVKQYETELPPEDWRVVPFSRWP